jgi:uncharacterized membrane protein
MLRLRRDDTPAARRVILLFAVGLIAGIIAAIFTSSHVAILIGWDVAALSYVTFVWTTLGGADSARTEAVATIEDDTRATAHLLVLMAAVASLAGTGFELYRASNSTGATKFFLSAIGVATVFVSWATVHTMFMLRYAHHYYTPPLGGIDFKSDERPDYRDFAYVAFTIGMTFQVSDTDIQSRAIRRTALQHALLSYLFGAVILAVMVNVVAGLIF